MQPRLGQGAFRIAVTSVYCACAALGRALAGRAITVPRTLVDQPDPDLLDWHAAEVFRG